MSSETGVTLLQCDRCGHAAKKPIAWVRTHSTFECEACGATVHFDGKKTLSCLDDLDRMIEAVKRDIEAITKGR